MRIILSSSRSVMQGPSNISDIVLQEVVQHRNLYHPNIMLFRKVILTETALGIVVEHAAGGNLQDYVRDSSPLQVFGPGSRKHSTGAGIGHLIPAGDSIIGGN